MKKALLIGAALLGAVSFASAQSLSTIKVQNNSVQQPREEATIQVCGELAEQVTCIGTNEPAIIAAAAKFDTDDLENYVGWEIMSVDFFPGHQACKYTSTVWADDMTILGQSEDSDPEMQTINNLALKTGVKIEAGKNYIVGYIANTAGGFPVGCDKGPAVDGYGDLVSISEDGGASFPPFESLHQAVPTLNYNIYVVVHLKKGEGVEAVLTNDKANAYVQNGVIYVAGANGRQVSLFDMNGKVVYTGVSETIAVPQKGMYILRVGAKSIKLAI
ncbi:hypothetical protein [Porphyromonas gingivalis]|uniref:hypothetical protein n=1 Tax=Porphyromonas gingivalis TaxID=837 RepID=UPI00037C11DC|nr:hypothetical protein [Porphyromonas gingivalis]ATS03470.1 hypothetical protein CS059_02465 [Porphyromonas gingivalis]EOA10242.1 hypothetical protein A343_1570 [Porphyromonas gingivalis JCVI SC001]